MAITDDNDRNGDAQLHYLHVASVLLERLQDVRADLTGDSPSTLTEILEVAAEEFRVEREDQSKSMKRRKGSTEKELVIKTGERRCTHLCREHKELMNPKLWKNLPQELLQLVVARLPVDEISPFQFLSKEWQRTITADSQFNQVFNEVYPKVICLITRSKENSFWVRVLDVMRSKWHVYRVVAGHPAVDWTARLRPTMIAACEDGGLVCFVTSPGSWQSKKKKAPLCLFFSVVNPLTRISRELPPLYDLVNKKLVQIQVERGTDEFKVMVLAYRCVWRDAKLGWTRNGLATHVYDSRTREWMIVPRLDNYHLQHRRFLTFDFVKEQLATMDDYTYLLSTPRSFLTTYARYKERLFLLQEGPDGPANEVSLTNQPSTLYIEEFHWETVWVKVKTHRCNPFEHLPVTDYMISLYACNGVLMVLAQISSHIAENRFRKKLAWLYDLSTSKWSILNLPQLPLGRRIYDAQEPSMFTLELPEGLQKIQCKY